MLRTKNPRGAWSSQDHPRAGADAHPCFNVVIGKKSGGRIDHIDNEIISIPMRLAQVNGGAKRLLAKEGSSVEIHVTFNMQVTLNS